jgi:NADPH-dependent ferric siderophore reductase
MTMLTAQARIALSDPQAVLAPLCAHMIEHEAQVSEAPGATIIRLGDSRAVLRPHAGALTAEVAAPDLAGLQEIKLAIASHVVEFAPAGPKPAIAWTGDGTQPMLPPDFRVLTVTGTQVLTPHMRRIRLRGEALGRFARLDALHVRLFFPPEGLAEPAWPMIGSDGLLQHPPPERRAAIRKYTIREIDPAAGTLAIDFVLHDDAGPGSAFAARARAGDRIGMAGPGGRGLKPAAHYLFLADETGLPAVARMLENLPADARGLAILEVADAGEEQVLARPAGVALRWLHRGGAAPGSLLPDAFAHARWPQDGGLYLWAACEFGAFREIRAAARTRLRPGTDEHLVVSYWRAGMDEDAHAAQKRLAAKAG